MNGNDRELKATTKAALTVTLVVVTALATYAVLWLIEHVIRWWF